MRFYRLKPEAAAVTLLGVLLSYARAEEPKDQGRQIETTSSPPKTDDRPVEKDFLDRFKEGSKYFQDIYVAQTSPEELEFGHVRETPDDWEQRFEKIDVDRGRHRGKVEGLEEELEEKKTATGSDAEKLKEKVRWGDKFGGYGEHYFDFNHHHDGGGDDGASTKTADDDADGKEKEKLTQKTNQSSEDPARDRRNLLGNADVEFISDAAREKIIAGATGMHGGNYKTEETGRVKRQDPAEFLDALAQE